MGGICAFLFTIFLIFAGFGVVDAVIELDFGAIFGTIFYIAFFSIILPVGNKQRS